MSLEKYLEKVDNSLFYRSDYPDIDVILVDGVYYAITTTMHFFPGGEILSSKDLIHWEHETFVYEVLDSTDAQTLNDGNIYGKGMWAASIRYHKGVFYVCFVANDTQKTYLYKSNNIKGPWTKHCIEGFYHDSSLLFDDDGRVYIVYGNKDIYITELDENLTKPKDGGLHKLLISDEGNNILGFEGTTALKINGTYYFFFIHSLPDRWRRVEACYYTDDLNGPLVGGDICNQDLGYKGSGLAQGCIVEGPDGKWYALLFQDRGAVGRTPVIIPMHFEGKMPVIEAAESINLSYIASQIESYQDNFEDEKLEGSWQWNHEPDGSLVSWGPSIKGLNITTDRLCDDFLKAKNTLTRRLVFPYTRVCVDLDTSKMNEGDVAGLAALLGDYGSVSVTVENGVVRGNNGFIANMGDVVTLEAEFFFGGEEEYVEFYINGNQAGDAKPISFKLDHFTGCRAALFMYSKKNVGGSARFSNFTMEW